MSNPWYKLGLSALCCLGLIPGARSQTSAKTFNNPVLFADYSDPDVFRDGSDYYLIASTFHFVPGIPILHSRDLVHWTIIAHVLPRIDLDPKYDMQGGNRYAGGVWAPSLRKHNGTFYVYFPTPDEGIFVSTAKKITGPWSKPVALLAKPKLEDPCPIWDDDGNAYLVHSVHGAGPLILHRMSPDGLKLLDDGKVIVEDKANLPTLEGPKFYKRHGYYYIFAPFGGVGTGKQVVLRSKSIYGPYEHRVVLEQGSTAINGPHQGGYVDMPNGESWFLHFQQRGAHGRIVHLEPMRWQSDDWPVMGDVALNGGEGTGQPVRSAPIPGNSTKISDARPQTSDEFNRTKLGEQWEWNHNPDDAHWSLTARKGYLRLTPTSAPNLIGARNTLTQLMQDNSLEFTTRIDLSSMQDGTHAGLSMFEKSASGVEIVQAEGKRTLRYFHLQDEVSGPELSRAVLQLRVTVTGQAARYSYSLDEGKTFTELGPETPIAFSWWKGSRPSLFAYTTGNGNAGHIDFDWAHYRPLGENPW